MKVKKYILIALQTCLLSNIAYGLPVGNPGEIGSLWESIVLSGNKGTEETGCPSSISLKSGFYGNYVFNRFLKTDVSKDSPIINIISDPKGPGPNPGTKYNNSALDQQIHTSQSFTNAGYVGCNFKNKLEIFGTLGASKESLEGPSAAFNLVGIFSENPINPGTTPLKDALNKGLVKIYTASGLAWSSGIKGLLINTDSFAASVSFQYSSSKNDIEHINVNSEALTFEISHPLGYKSDILNQGILPNTLTNPPSEKGILKSNEWQTSLGLAYRLNDFIPYVAFNFSQSNLRSHNIIIPEPIMTFNLRPSTEIASNSQNIVTGGIRSVCLKLNNLKSRKHYGFTFGTSFIEDDRISVTVEGRLVDESAFHINTLFRF